MISVLQYTIYLAFIKSSRIPADGTHRTVYYAIELFERLVLFFSSYGRVRIDTNKIRSFGPCEGKPFLVIRHERIQIAHTGVGIFFFGLSPVYVCCCSPIDNVQLTIPIGHVVL